MSEPEKKGSAWPWILVPVAAVSLFFVLRQCRQNIPPAESIETTEAVKPASENALGVAALPGPDVAPVAGPAPQ